jgi:hypothetical protein
LFERHVPNLPRQYSIWNVCNLNFLKTEMFEFRCVNTRSWKLKFEICMWNVWNLNFENWNVWIGMCEYLKLKIENWNLYVKRLEFENLKTEMSEFGCVNTKSWKLKIEIWNLFVKCLEGIWNLKNWMFKYWKLKIKCLNTKN